MKKSLIIFIFIISTLSYSYGQCVQCQEQTASGLNASIIGPNNTASGAGSVAMGANSHTPGLSAIAIGGMLEATNPYSFVIGTGGTPSKKLINSYAESLMIGFNSIKPTLFISTSPSNLQYDRTGKVGIGNITEPYAKLHIKADEGEYAAVFIEPNTWTENSNATLLLGNMFHGLTANNEYGLVFSTQKNYIFNNGNVGIGTQIPEEKLHVNGTILTNGFKMPQPEIEDGYVLTTDRNGNSAWMPTQSLWKLGENNNIYYLRGNVGIGTDTPYEKLQVGELFTFHSGGTKFIGYNVYWDGGDKDDADGTGDKRIVDDEVSCIRFGSNGDINFWTAPSGDPASPIEYNKPMIITNDGNVGIGTLETNGYRLAVAGKILAEELKIIGDVLSSDYVFYDDYDLKPLSEVESYIDKHNHLPDVPSADEFKENGYNIGEMDDLLLRKIEELTLYLIEQQKIIDKQQKDIGLLKKLIEKK